MLYAALFTLMISSCNNNNVTSVVTRDSLKTKDTVAAVSVIKKDTINPFAYTPFVHDSTKSYIYLTFDDGPQSGTEEVFNLCKQLGVKATFFMVGRHAGTPKTKEWVSNIRNAYPQILLANHSNTHANERYRFFYTHPEMAEQDFLTAQQSLNVPLKIIRLPGNSAWVRTNEIKASGLVRPVCKILDSLGFNVIGWDVEWSFTRDRFCRPVESPEKMADEVNGAIKNKWAHTHGNVVILSHDRMFQRKDDLDSLAKFITILKENPNNVFETIDHYPGIKHP
jgi:peptidoglycan/xylan/chitin deacetylase (PgdA/CDA1 family)